MDAFQWWENLWHPIAKPTADLGSEALRMYRAGEIDEETYLEATGRATLLTEQIADAKKDYENYVAANSLDPGNVLKPVTDLSKNLLALLLVAGAIYLLVAVKRLEA